MIRYLLHRSIGVCVVTLTLTVLGILAFSQLPVSLLPDIAVPEIIVKVSYPSASARELQRIVEQPLRNQLVQVAHVDNINSVTQDGLSVLTLHFSYGTNIRLAYLETNEKIDGILSQLPYDLERPKVIKSGAGDIPVFTLNVLPKLSYQEDFLALSEFGENVLKRRIEQLHDVALVDITGGSQPQAVVQIDAGKMAGLGLSEQQVIDAIKQANGQPGNFSVREGPYQYNIRFSSVLRTLSDIGSIAIVVGGPTTSEKLAQNDPRVSYFADNVLTSQEGRLDVPKRVLVLRDIATITLREQPLRGMYTFNGNRGLGLAIIKQSDAQLLHLRRELGILLAQFNTDYPQLKFALSQNQTELLNLSINNLIGNLLTGALLTVGMIFLFMRDWRLPLLIGLVIPVSIAVTFLCFYLLGMSINIVSLAGLVLGMGEIVDSAIVILENVEEKHQAGTSVEESCVSGADEVIRPLFTSVLTNSVVYLPLLLLSGLAGSLFFDQALSVSLALGVSLLCSYTLVPVLYFLIYRNRPAKITRSPTWAAHWLEICYNATFQAAFRFKWWLALALGTFLAGAGWMAGRIEKQGMPDVSRTEMEVFIDWNEPLTVTENQRRIRQLTQVLRPTPLYISAYVGQQQFLLNRQLQQTESQTLLSIQTETEAAYSQLAQSLSRQLSQQYPRAVVVLRPARNVFEQVFGTTEPPLRLHVYSTQGKQPPPPLVANRLAQVLTRANLPNQSVQQQSQLTVHLLSDKLLLYDIPEEAVIQTLKTIFNNNSVTSIQGNQRFTPVVLSGPDIQTDWQNTFVFSRQKQAIPLRSLIAVTPQTDYTVIYADKEGPFIPFNFEADARSAGQLQDRVMWALRTEPDILLSWSGRYFHDRMYLTELLGIVTIAIALMFCILVAQFESIQQPLIVLLVIILGLAGAIWALYFFGNNLNVMSVIGIIVLIGLLDNDSIIKIDTINRGITTMSLMEAIRSAGQRRLKSQIMTFLTTVLGLLPVLFSGGLGSELQQPLAISVVGGMFIGVIVSWTVIPLLYWLLAIRK